MTKWLLELKAESLKTRYWHTHPSLSQCLLRNNNIKKKKKKTHIQPSSHILHDDRATIALSLHAYHFTPARATSSLSCCALRRPRVPPPASAWHSLLASMWPRWHRYEQLECEGVRLMCSSACGSVALLSFFISSRCVMSKAAPSLVSAEFLRWLFSTCCWSCRPPPHTCQSELRITHRVGAVAAVNRATSRLPGCDTARVWGEGSDLFRLVSLHVVSQDGAWHVTPLSWENLKNSKRCVTFNLETRGTVREN